MSLKSRIREMKAGGQAPTALIGGVVTKYLIERPPDIREDGWHISDICMMCARARALRVRQDPGFGSDPTTERIFDMGKGIHHIYQNWYLGPAKVLWGKWKCLRCEREEWGLRPEGLLDGKGCEHDDRPHSWKYMEIPVRVKAEDRLKGYDWAEKGLKDGDFKDIVGHADGLVLCGNPLMWVCPDFKSCKDEIFKFVYAKEPHEAHRRQVNLYGYFIKRGFVEASKGVEIPDPERVSVMYINKNTSEEREHIDSISEALVKESMNEVTKFDRYSVTGELPDPHPACPDKSSKRAKRCGESTACFATR